MDTILDYVRNETRSFEEFPFNDADALVFALLTYDRIPDQVPSLASIEQRYGTLRARLRAFRLRHPLQSVRTLRRPPFHGLPMEEVQKDVVVWERRHPDIVQGTTGFVSAELCHDFYQGAANNPRYAQILVNAKEEIFSEDQQTQFAVETFLLPNNTIIISFRGTDDSFVGWREDFNMAYQYPVPAQRTACEYVERVAKLWPQYRIVITGHSKGGNLAVYAGMNVRDDVKDRIERVYSMDGPGFPRNVVDSYEYSTIVDRVVKIVPESSIIGMIMLDPPSERIVVVKSDASGIEQHSAFTWLMDGDRFETVPELSETSQVFDTSLNEWLMGMSQRQREKSVSALFRVLEASGRNSVSALVESPLLSLPRLFGTYVGLDSDERKYLNQAAMLVASALRSRPSAHTESEHTIDPDTLEEAVEDAVVDKAKDEAAHADGSDEPSESGKTGAAGQTGEASQNPTE